MADQLTDALRRKLNVTWSDEDTDARLADILDSAKLTVGYKLGLPDGFDFEAVGQERALLLSYCLYEWNHATSEFDGNYANDILQLRQKWGALDAEAD